MIPKSNTIRLVFQRSCLILPLNSLSVTQTVGRTFTAITTCNNMTVNTAATIDATTSNTTWSSKMIAWQVHSYGTIDDLVLTSNSRSPVMVGTKDILVRVKASSVNPLDVLMAG